MAHVLSKKKKQEQRSSRRTGMRKIREMELRVWQMLGGRDAGCPGDSEEMFPWAIGGDVGPLRRYPQTTWPYLLKVFSAVSYSFRLHGL